ncbi:hypothetical protein RHGRI_016918 [Rhododendron griersonianum]|uniref:UBL3-like ubiquitin domain-containing protein n=1 Tax=Rhododendron griersonianum TaxID=479676 RepID=A0AAV6JVY7_9ERIC|nr:hypothetical protein RHGRI_016918 [Rhododendron griersonianum]
MAEENLVEIKFKLADGTDIGPTNCSPSTSVGSLKERIVAQWPKAALLFNTRVASISFFVISSRKLPRWTDKENAPKTVNDVKLINAGKILENNKTLAESRLPIGELPGVVITMHVVVRPPISDNNGVVAETRFQDVSFPSVAVFVALMLLLTANVHSTRSSSMREGIRCIARREALWIKKPFSVPGEDTKCDKDKTEKQKEQKYVLQKEFVVGFKLGFIVVSRVFKRVNVPYVPCSHQSGDSLSE